jgi:hypothetical protein
LGAALFSQFFLLTLYMQQVLHYSALKTGVAYVGITLTIIIVSAVAQALATRIGVRPLLPIGMALAAVALVLYARLPVHGHYFTDLFPAFIIGGVGMALVFVPISIGALTGVRDDEAGIASGLLNTSSRSVEPSASPSPARSRRRIRATTSMRIPAAPPPRGRRSHTVSRSHSGSSPASRPSGASSGRCSSSRVRRSLRLRTYPFRRSKRRRDVGGDACTRAPPRSVAAERGRSGC